MYWDNYNDYLEMIEKTGRAGKELPEESWTACYTSPNHPELLYGMHPLYIRDHTEEEWEEMENCTHDELEVMIENAKPLSEEDNPPIIFHIDMPMEEYIKKRHMVSADELLDNLRDKFNERTGMTLTDQMVLNEAFDGNLNEYIDCVATGMPRHCLLNVALQSLFSAIIHHFGYEDDPKGVWDLREYAAEFKVENADPLVLQLDNLSWIMSDTDRGHSLNVEINGLQGYMAVYHSPSEFMDILTWADKLLPEFMRRIDEEIYDQQKDLLSQNIVLSRGQSEMGEVMFPGTALEFPKDAFTLLQTLDDYYAKEEVAEFVRGRISEVRYSNTPTPLFVVGEMEFTMDQLCDDTPDIPDSEALGKHMALDYFRMAIIFSQVNKYGRLL